MIAAEDKERRGLGRGLSALFGEGGQGAGQLGAQVTTTLPIDLLKPGKFQPRRHFDEAALETLIASVKEKGVLEPILVRDSTSIRGEFEIIAGERRWRAAQAAQLHDVPVVVKELNDQEALEIALVENLHREDLSPLEEAEAYNRLMRDFGHTQDGLAKSIGKSRSHVANMVRLLTLPQSVRMLLLEGKLSAGHARTLVSAENPEKLAELIISKGMSVREAEKLSKKPITKEKLKDDQIATENATARDPNTVDLENRVSDTLGLKVVIDEKGEAGVLSIHYQRLEQLDDLIQLLDRG
ncbi:MAG: chromosome partitioning protein ParB [Rhodospirillaceae bacterium]|nr:chromosome partitioning protein ParB [Rhodospirillaceae bacterium]